MGIELARSLPDSAHDCLVDGLGKQAVLVFEHGAQIQVELALDHCADHGMGLRSGGCSRS